uniref:Uncharacterized protein n=1 Tax=Plectus sambesii TaxID=2011161 RepID=A0A914VZD1_9BILA
MSSAQVAKMKENSITKKNNIAKGASAPVILSTITAPSSPSSPPPPSIPVRKKTWTEVMSQTSIQAIPEAINSKRPSKRRIWIAVAIISNVCCVIHLYFLLQTFIVSPNAVSISIERRSQLTMPRIHVCQPTSRFIDTNLAANVSAAYYYAIELGLGLIRSDEPLQYKYRMDLAEVEREYENIMRTFKGNIAAAHLDLYDKYGMKCEAIFQNCRILYEHQVNCCDIFEPVYTLNGLCWVSKKGSIVVSGPESLASFRFRLKFPKYSDFKIPHFLPQPENSDDIYSAMSYFVGIADFLDQSPRWNDKFIVGPQEWFEIKLTQTQITWLDNSDVCVNDPDNERTLRFFQDYDSTNCAVERLMLRNLSLLNSSCELPLVELMKPGYTTDKPCSLSQILKLYNYYRMEDQPITEEVANVLSDLVNFSIPESLAGQCSLTPQKNLTLSRCTVRHLKQLNFTGEALDIVDSLDKANSVPQSILSIMAKLQAECQPCVDSCLPSCESTQHTFSKEWRTDRRRIPLPESEIFLFYSTKNVQVIEEQPRQSISEYIAMIGGNFGVWNGASLISFFHFFALVMIGMGFNI